MPIDITCPQCAARYRVGDHLAGKKAKCKHCQSSIEIPVLLEDDPPDEPVTSVIAAPASAPAQPLSYGRSKPRGPSQVLLFTDQIHRWISFGLIILWAGFVLWSVHDTLKFVSDFIPEGLLWRFYFLVGLTFLWVAFIVGGLIAPGIMAACRFAGEWTGGDMPNDSYLRSCGAASVVAILTVLVGRMILIRYGFSRHFLDEVFKDGEVVSLSIAAPLILAVAIRATLGRSWPATFIIEGLCFVILFLVGTGLRYANPPVQKAMVSIARLSPEDLAQYHKDHPDDMPAFTKRPPAFTSPNMPSPPNARTNPSMAPAYKPTPPTPDPMQGKMDGISDRLRQLELAANTGTREQLRPQYDQLQKDLAALLPKEPSMLYNRAKRRLSDLEEKIQSAPSEKPPADLNAPITAPLAISKSSEDLFGTMQYRFNDLTITQLKSARIDIKSYAGRDKTLKWKFADERDPTATMTIQPLLDDGKQQRPWLVASPVVEQIAAKQNLFSAKLPRDADVTTGQINGIGWTRITPSTKSNDTSTRRAVYIARLPSSWAIVTLTAAWPHAEFAEARGDALIQGIRLAKPDDAKRTAYDPTFVVEEYSGTWHDDPAPILRDAGQDGITALRDYIAKHNGPSDAERLLRELTQQRIETAERHAPRGAAPKSMEIDIDDALKRIDSGGTFERSAAFRELALAKVDESKRDAVAEVLENKFATSTFSDVEPIGKALEAWWRPQTVVALLPFLEEKADRWKRSAAMRILAATKDKKAVYPILRWLIKEPEEVVKDLKSMGPVAEDEVVKLLRDRNNEVRRNAARILEEIGTQKSLLELRRASTDPRDASAAASAKLAVDSVMNRTKQPKPATTRTAS
jgi:predicted Zn finger-like uncharacterized protein